MPAKHVSEGIFYFSIRLIEFSPQMGLKIEEKRVKEKLKTGSSF